ncbi:MAG: MFS transporter [Dysgonamonadaceae bacterium]|jgi:fucose permease|nr:MFS transporter [Dysgonamonadaceae bacterium]
MKSNKFLFQLVPVMLAFFAMGAVDMVGIASNYVQKDFKLSDTVAGFLPSMVFLWFFIFSVPTGLLMNKIGRKKTVLASLAITVLALIIPVLSYSFWMMLFSFSLLGIGNTLMQVSLNPLISNIVAENRFASTLTFGQFVKAIASFAAPLIAGFMAVKFNNWKLLFPLYAVLSALPLILLSGTGIEEKPYESKSSFLDCFRLLGNGTVLMFFMGIMAHVGIDVGINTIAPRILIERIPEMTLETAGVATSVYFLFRLLGCFSGSFILARFSNRKFFIISCVLIALSAIGLFFFSNLTLLYVCMALVGFGNSNIFPIIFTTAVKSQSEHENEISGLMIMGVAGGAVFPLLMGVASDAVHAQAGAIVVVALLVAYLFILSQDKHIKALS